MIKNIIFDMGGVLRKFNREAFILEFKLNKEDSETLMNEVLLSVEWSMMDRGSLLDEEACERVKHNLPDHLKKYADILVLHWEDMSKPVPGMADLIKELKDNGYGIYLLSNASKRIHEYFKSIPGSEYFDGHVVSCDYGYVKPQDEIYKMLNVKYGLKLDECLFIDDTPINIEGAMHNGMDGIVFHGSVKELREKLKKKGIKVTE